MNRRDFLAGCLATSGAAALAAAERTAAGGLQAGVNLGTWISQYNRKAPEFDTRVRESDIAQIASWGMDHVRLPIDYDFFEEAPYQYSEPRLGYADRTIEWARKNGLNIVLDLHHAPGYTFTNVGGNELFSSPAMQSRFLAIWKNFARRYGAHGEYLAFELLNEVVEATPAQWNGLIARALAAIREIDPKRKVVVGGVQYNSVNALKDIAILDDPYIIYTFHFYLPMFVTHQKARWVKMAMDYDRFTGGARIDYPGSVPRLKAFVAAYPQYKGEARHIGVTFDKEWLRAQVQPAVDFVRTTGKPLYCGEYGVIRYASGGSKERWYFDFSDILRRHNIGRAAWCYKDAGFGLVDELTSKVLNGNVVRIASRKG